MPVTTIRDLMLGRRSLLLGAGLAVFGEMPIGRAAARSNLAQDFAEIEAGLGGRLGLAAFDTGTGERLSHRSDERFALCSTFKWLLAAGVLSRVDQGTLSLDRRVPYSAADMLGYAPVTREHLAEGSLAVGDLCAAAVEVSDNTAANLLLSLVGGPSGLTDQLRDWGDSVTRLDRMEPSLNSNLPGDPRDTTTPNAMIRTMGRVLLGDALSLTQRGRLIGWMRNCRTGLGRLRAGVPVDWIAADKTGTGPNGSANDNAILWPPGRAPILVAAYLSGSVAPGEALDAVHAKLGAAISAAFAGL